MAASGPEGTAQRRKLRAGLWSMQRVPNFTNQVLDLTGQTWTGILHKVLNCSTSSTLAPDVDGVYVWGNWGSEMFCWWYTCREKLRIRKVSIRLRVTRGKVEFRSKYSIHFPLLDLICHVTVTWLGEWHWQILAASVETQYGFFSQSIAP